MKYAWIIAAVVLLVVGFIGYNALSSNSPMFSPIANTTNSTNSSTQTGGLKIASIPTSASIYLDGVNKGTTPKTLNGLTPRFYRIKLTKSGYNSYIVDVRVIAGRTISINATLMPVTNSTNPTNNSNRTNSTG